MLTHTIISTIIQSIKDGIIFGIVGFLTALITIPLIFLKNHKQQTGLDYIDISKAKLKQFGWTIFYTGALSWGIFNFIDTFCFGISESIAMPILDKFNLTYHPIGIIIRTVLIGFIQTACVIYFDFKMISKQKNEFIVHAPEIKPMIIPSFLRNTFIWGGTTCALYIIHHLNNKLLITTNLFLETIISLNTGVIFALIALPFDFVTTQIVGHTTKNISIYGILHTNIKQKGIKYIFKGGTMLISELTIVTITITLTHLFIK